MPVLLEAKQIDIEFADLDRLVEKRRVYTGPRSSGVHLSGVIRYVLQAAGLLRDEELDDMMPLCMCVGLAWEQWVVQLWPELVWQPGEYCCDGIYGSPDGYSGKIRHCYRCGWPKENHRSEILAHHSECTLEQYVEAAVLEEVKATFMSRLDKSETRGVRPAEKVITHQKRWMMQLAGYCKMMGVTRARLHVLWIRGDYRGSGPEYYTYLIEFSQGEIDRMWDNLILPNVGMAKAEIHA